MDKDREAQIAAVKSRYDEINKEIKSLKIVINTKKNNGEATNQEEEKMKELINSLRTAISRINELRVPAGSTSGDKEPNNFIFDMISSSFEGLMSTSLAPVELLIQLVNFFVKLFIEFVKQLVNEIKRFVKLLFEQLKNLFPDIGTLYDAVGKIDNTSKTNQSLWFTIVDLLSNIIKALKLIFARFSELFMQFAGFIIKEVKFFAETLVTQLKKLFPDISTLYDAVSIIESTSKTNQSLWGSMVQLLVKIIDSFKNIFSNFLGMFSSRINALDGNINTFNRKVTELTKIANVNKELVNTTKTNFNNAIGKIKEEFEKLKRALNSVSGKSISLGGFGSVPGPSFDLSSIDSAITGLDSFVVSLQSVENTVSKEQQAKQKLEQQAAAAAKAAEQQAAAAAKAAEQAAQETINAAEQALQKYENMPDMVPVTSVTVGPDMSRKYKTVDVPNMQKTKALDDLINKLNLCDKCTGMEVFKPLIKEINVAQTISKLYQEYENINPKMITTNEYVQVPQAGNKSRIMSFSTVPVEYKITNPSITAKLKEILDLLPVCGNVCNVGKYREINAPFINNKINSIDAEDKLSRFKALPNNASEKAKALKELNTLLESCGSNCPQEVKEAVSTANTIQNQINSTANSVGNSGNSAVNTGTETVNEISSSLGL